MATIPLAKKLEIATFLQDKLNPKDERGFISYKRGWTDEKVAKHFKCTSGHVRGVRMQVYGKFDPQARLPKKKPEQSNSAVKGSSYDDRRKAFWAGYNDLRATVGMHQSEIVQLMSRIARLEKEWFGPPTKPEPVPSDLDQTIHRREA